MEGSPVWVFIYSYTPGPISDCAHHILWIHQTSERYEVSWEAVQLLNKTSNHGVQPMYCTWGIHNMLGHHCGNDVS